MKKNYLLTAGIVGVMMLTGCTTTGTLAEENTSVEESTVEAVEESSGIEVSEEVNSDTEASTEEATEADSEETVSEDKEFYYKELADKDKLDVDLGNDGKMDTVLLEQKNSTCTVQINDQKIEKNILVENGLALGSVNAVFVHKTDGDYIMLQEGGIDHFGNVTLYKWEDDTMEEVGNLEGSYVIDSNADGEREIYADKVIIGESFNVLGSLIGTKEYKYDQDGFTTYDKWLKLHSTIANSDGALTLKKAMTFTDESGDPPKTLEAGTKVVPCEAKGNCAIGFNTVDGEYIGELMYETKEVEYGEEIYFDGLSKDEVFDGIEYIG